MPLRHLTEGLGLFGCIDTGKANLVLTLGRIEDCDCVSVCNAYDSASNGFSEGEMGEDKGEGNN